MCGHSALCKSVYDINGIGHIGIKALRITMKKQSMNSLKVIALTIGSALLMNCGQNDPDETAGTSKNDSTIYEVSATISPYANYYLYVNETWLNEAEIPAGFSSYSVFTDLTIAAEETLNAIIAESSATLATDENNAHDLIADYVDPTARGADDEAGVQAVIAKIRSTTSAADLLTLMAAPQYGFVLPVSIETSHATDGSALIRLSQSGLGLTDKNAYLSLSAREKLRSYEKFVEEFLALAGETEATTIARAVIALETDIARAHWSPEKRNNPLLNNTPITLDELEIFAPNANWAAQLKARSIAPDTPIVLQENEAIADIISVFTSAPTNVQQGFAIFHFLRANAPALPTAYRSVASREDPSYPKDVIRFAETVLPGFLAAQYEKRHARSSTSTRGDFIATTVLDQFKERIAQAEWLDENGRALALQALDDVNIQLRVDAMNTAPPIVRGATPLARLMSSRTTNWPASLPVNKTPPFKVGISFDKATHTLSVTPALMQSPILGTGDNDAGDYGTFAMLVSFELARFIAATLNDNPSYNARVQSFTDAVPQTPFANQLALETDALALALGAYKRTAGENVNAEEFFRAYARLWARLPYDVTDTERLSAQDRVNLSLTRLPEWRALHAPTAPAPSQTAIWH